MARCIHRTGKSITHMQQCRYHMTVSVLYLDLVEIYCVICNERTLLQCH